MKQTTLSPSRARLGGLLRIGGAHYLITAIGKPVRFDEAGWPVEVEIEIEKCNPQPQMCNFVNGDDLSCLNEAEDGDGRCSWHPVISSDARRAMEYGTGDDRRWPNPMPH